MKRIVSVFLAALMLVAFSSCRNGIDSESSSPDATEQAINDVSTTKQPQENVIKIGVFEPQTGDDELSGKQEMLGIMYANSCTPTVRIDGKEIKVRLIYGDNESSPEKAQAVAKALVDEGVCAVIGSYGSDVSAEAASAFSDAGVPAVAAGCTGENVTAKGETYYRICFIDPYQARTLATYTFKQLGIRKLCILATLGNSASQGLSLYFKEAFEALGGSVVTENFLPGTTDFTACLKKAVKNECETVFAPVSLVYAERILEQSAQFDTGFTFIGDSGWDSNIVLQAAGKADARVYVSSYYQPGTNEEFESGFKAWLDSNTALKNNNNNGEDTVSAACAAGFDAYNAVITAIEKVGSADRQKIKEALGSVKLNGACSSLKFLSSRNASRSLAYIKTANDSFDGWTVAAEQKF